ncbi:MAG: B-box zinc finger protein [Anaerolineae bacterium]|nr:B-box zinc finger protein [Anaerolineae bacterium]
MMTSTTTTCANHPNKKTGLRCNRCEKLICASCAVLTPTGYRCKECIRNHQKVFDTAEWYDYISAFVVAALLSNLGIRFTSVVGFFMILLAPVAGTIIAEAVRWVVRRRRSTALFKVAAAGVAIGALPMIIDAVSYLFYGYFPGFLSSFIWPGLYIVLASSSAYYRLSGIQIGR